MIPLKLHIKNFVSYGCATQIVDFTPYNLICLSGKNGHGKSALLDALTWALWGQARKTIGTIKADDGLLRLGQTHMMVCLDFISNNTHYRIRREYTQSSKNHTNLEFGIIDPVTAHFKPLTDKTIKATQDKIETMIGVDYDSFINSAFLRQGQSNEFSKKSPKDRKEILATILGLNQFERLRKRSSDKVRQATIEKEYILKTHEHLKQELEQKASIVSQLHEISYTLQTLETQETIYKQQVQEIKQQHQEITHAKTRWHQLTFQKNQIAATISEHTQHVISEITTWRLLFRQQKTLLDFASLEKTRITLQQELLSLQAQARELIVLKEKLLCAKELYAQRITTVAQDYTHKRQHNTLALEHIIIYMKTVGEKLQESCQKQAHLVQEVAYLERELALLQHNCDTNKTQKELTGVELQFDKRKACYQKFIAQLQRFKLEVAELESKKHTIIDTTQQPSCPLCQQDLPQAHKKKLLDTFKQKEAFIAHQTKRLTAIIKQLKIILTEQHAYKEQLKQVIEKNIKDQVKKEELIKTLDKRKQEHSALESSIYTLQQTLKQHALDQEKIKQEQETLEYNYKNTLEHDKELKERAQEIIVLEQQLTSFCYNPEQEAHVSNRLQEITTLIHNQSELIKESARQEQRKNTISTTSKTIKQLKIVRKTLEEELANYSNFEHKEQEYLRKEQELSQTMHAHSAEKERLIHLKGGLEQQRLLLEKKEQEYKRQTESIKLLDQSIDDYTAITAALSKDGIQALLIEDALPEIEHEANILLSRLTDNQAHLFIESLRDLRSGGTKETLDIKISDSSGIRPYELFSGGEAFRIDFALRIAISKLLARRSGLSLQTLIIDEGFGSQDEEGLAHIMDALHKIQDDFAKIIIVSHLPAMKDQFPVHFLIYKTAHGSTVKVIENN